MRNSHFIYFFSKILNVTPTATVWMSNGGNFKSNYENEFSNFPSVLLESSNFNHIESILHTKWFELNLIPSQQSACDSSHISAIGKKYFHQFSSRFFFIFARDIFSPFSTFSLFTSIFTVFHNNFHRHKRIIELWFISIHIHRTNFNIFFPLKPPTPTIICIRSNEILCRNQNELES